MFRETVVRSAGKNKYTVDLLYNKNNKAVGKLIKEKHFNKNSIRNMLADKIVVSTQHISSIEFDVAIPAIKYCVS